jgi:hypothetical protein
MEISWKRDKWQRTGAGDILGGGRLVRLVFADTVSGSE